MHNIYLSHWLFRQDSCFHEIIVTLSCFIQEWSCYEQYEELPVTTNFAESIELKSVKSETIRFLDEG